MTVRLRKIPSEFSGLSVISSYFESATPENSKQGILPFFGESSRGVGELVKSLVDQCKQQVTGQRVLAVNDINLAMIEIAFY